MPKADWNPFDLETGFLSDYDLEVHTAEFILPEAKENQEFAPRIQLELRGFAVQDGEVVNDTIAERYAIGDGWEIREDGESVVHTSGKVDKRFNTNSQYGHFIANAVECAPEFFKGLVEAGKVPQDASIWVGTSWHMNEKEYGSEKFKSVRNYPTAFNGMLGTAKPDTGPPAEMEQAVIEAAKNSETFEEFLSAALAIKGITAYDSLVSQIGDSDYFEKVKKA